MNLNPTTFQSILEKINHLLDSDPATKAVLGEGFLDVDPKAIIFKEVKITTDNGWVKLRSTTPAARPGFEWLAELTLDSATGVEHYLLREGNDLVFAIGRQLREVGEAEAQELLSKLDLIAN